MAQSSSELTAIHLRRLATPGKKYYGDNEKVYLGTENGRLKLLEQASNIVFASNVPNPGNNVQTVINNLSNTNQVTAEANIIATPSGIQSNARLLICDINLINIVATTGDSVKLKKAIYGVKQYIINNGLNDMNVYPLEGDRFIGMAINIPFIIGSNNGFTFTCYKNEDGIFRY